MKFFKDQQGAIDYIIPELIATLQDDINDQTRNGVPALEMDGELEEKIADISEVQSLVEAGPDLLEALKDSLIYMKERDPVAYRGAIKAINKAEGR